ncbi:MAG TPA: ThuA domain-containing protein [Chthonomonadaceae bacterium]|nr:ThuA domain-containing protein [Chthonomonadaceae bacterium]
MAENGPVRVLVWDEKPPHAPEAVYPKSINGAIAEGLQETGGGQFEVRVANLNEPSQGLDEETLSQTDVLLWWGHIRHGEVQDETVARVVSQVHGRGMGFIALHSAHYSKTFRAVVEGHGHLKGGWREAEPPDSEEITVCAPRHPIAAGVSDFVLDREEMYGSPFDVPPPLCLVFQSYFPLGGEYFPSGICWTVGPGKTEGFTSGPGGGVGEGFGIGRVFYFRPGHETFPTYYNPNVRRVIHNAALWCAKRT